jgi:hypothetical protein
MAPDYLGNKVTLRSYFVGDMDRKNGLDAADGPAFAMAMVNPLAYKSMTGIYGNQSGDIDGNNVFDFDDVDDFVAIHPNVFTAEELFALIADYGQTVPEPSSAMLLGLGALSGVFGRRGPLRYSTPI